MTNNNSYFKSKSLSASKVIKKTLTGLIISSFLLINAFPFSQVFAQNNDSDLDKNLEAIGRGAEYSVDNVSENTLPALIGNIISIILGFVGSIFFILVIVSGIQWMTAGGNEETVKKARTRLINSVIGLAITVSAYAITWLVSNVFAS